MKTNLFIHTQIYTHAFILRPRKEHWDSIIIMETNTKAVVWRVREVCLLPINVRVLSELSSTHFLKFSLDPLVIHENQYCYIVFWKVLSCNINHTWKVKLLYIYYWHDVQEKKMLLYFPPSNISRHAIYFNWFNTQNHIKISWKVQLKCYFTYLRCCLQRLLTTGIQLMLGTLLPPLEDTSPLADGESHIGLPSFLRH